ncbi:MAG TPA: IS110 family transposase [Thermodesulfovibrionales bacterium]|nr:IS110 family transposase [Thermodesulfovibrionales bacterium]
MLNNDYNKQYERRQRIKRTTLVMGIDIGADFNAIGFMNKDGNILGKLPIVYNSREGFNKFVRVTEELKAKHGLKDVLIGLEPTGHYWRKIAYFAKDQGYAVRFIRTTSLKHERELNESSSAKSDIKDALTLTNLTREGKYIDTIIEDGIARQLRTLSKVREKIQRQNTGAQNMLHAVLDDYFPELKNLFWAMNSKGLWAILETCPFPEDVLKLKRAAIADMIAKASRRKAEAAGKASALYLAAQTSIGLKLIGTADRYRMAVCLKEVKRTEGMLKEIQKELKDLLNQLPSAQYLLSIPGVGYLSAAVFLGELGNPAYFHRAKQIIKYAGYDPQESDSGKKIGRKVISKKGRWLLRKFLYLMSLRAVVHSRFFQAYYKRRLETKNRFGQLLKRKEALCAVAIKLIKVIFALLRDKREFQDTVSFALAA